MKTTRDISKLTMVRIIHTLVWIAFNVIIFYFVYSALADKIGLWTWICLTLIIGEGMVLLMSGNVCPITTVARHYSDSTKENFDIYLPIWLAKYNKEIYSIIVWIGVVVLILRLIE